MTGGPVHDPSETTRPASRVLWWLFAIVASFAVLAGLFLLGTQLPGWFAGNAAMVSETPAPTPATLPTAPQPAGEHAWNTLFGGECLQPFESPWAERFTVVDCASPHAAQLVYRGSFGLDPQAPYPGESELASQINILCGTPSVISQHASSSYPDLQLQGAFPANAQRWADGDRSYYCFVNRAGGEHMTTSIVTP